MGVGPQVEESLEDKLARQREENRRRKAEKAAKKKAEKESSEEENKHVKELKKLTAGFKDDPSDLDEHYQWETSFWNPILTKINNWVNYLRINKKYKFKIRVNAVSSLVDEPIWGISWQTNEVILIKKNDIK